MSTERIDCPVEWCEGDARGHRPRNAHDFHMSDDTAGPLHLAVAFVQVDDGPIKLALNGESWAGELTFDEGLETAREAFEAYKWLLGKLEELAALNAKAGR